MQQNTSRVAEYFDNNWDSYLSAVSHDTLNHTEMFGALDSFLAQQDNINDITLADLGCGDSSAILNTLKRYPIRRYIGVDAAAGILSQATQTLADVNCEKQFFCDDIGNVVQKLPEPMNIIFTSYTLHHLSFENKKIFIQHCQDKLTQDGHLIIIDGVLEENQTRDEWLQGLREKMSAADPNLSENELNYLMQHPNNDDYPESIATYLAIAREQNWGNCQVIINKGMYAYLLFSKSA